MLVRASGLVLVLKASGEEIQIRHELKVLPCTLCLI